MAVLDVHFMKYPGWSCAAPCLFVTFSRARNDQDSARAGGVASSLIRNTGVKEVEKRHNQPGGRQARSIYALFAFKGYKGYKGLAYSPKIWLIGCW
eukprot:1136941-Pelagomonas_calceolata.AAC.1